MTTSSRPRRLLLAAVALSLATVAVGTYLLRKDELPANAAFRYDGRTVTSSQVDAYGRLQTALYGTKPPLAASATDAYRRGLAQSMVVSDVITHLAGTHGIAVTDAQVDAAEKAFVQKAYPQGESAFVDALAAQGVNEQQVKDEIRHQLIVKGLYDSVTATTTVTTDEVATVYAKNPGKFRTPEQRRLAEIVVTSQTAARNVVAQLAKGTSFTALAKSQSLDQSTSAHGGDLGWVSRDQLQGPFGASAFATSKGRVFGPVTADGGHYLYIGRVDDIRAARQQPLAEVQTQLTQELTVARGLDVWEAFLTRSLHQAHVRYAGRFKPADPYAVPSDPASPTPSASPSPGATP